MQTATMMKRTLSNWRPVLHDPETPKEHNMAVRKALNTDIQPVELHEVEKGVGPQEENDGNGRRSSTAKYFAVISAILTVMLVRDIFRQVAPQTSSPEASFTLDGAEQIDNSDPAADFHSGVVGQREAGRYLLEFDFDASAIHCRRTAKHLLETLPVQLPGGKKERQFANLRHVWDKQASRTN